MKKVISFMLALLLVLGLASSVMAETETECEACNEILTTQDVIYNDDGEAMCIYCEEILSQAVLNALFYEEESEEEETCSVCGEVAGENAILTDDGLVICDICSTSEDEEYESDDPDEYTPDPEEQMGVVLIVSEWAKKEADEAYARNLIPLEMLGTDLKMDIPREQFAAIAVALYERITGKVADDSTENLPFTDCSPTGTYSRYVAAAYKLGITTGTSETTFAPSATITREQLSTMLYRVILKAREDGIIENEMPITLDEFAFDDDAQISEYAHESVYYMAKRGIIKGMSETEFAPQGVATKEQAILISNRIVANLY